jgi:uncharacterized protein
MLSLIGAYVIKLHEILSFWRISMKVLISGASGLIGQALTHALQRDGNDVTCLVRRKAAPTSEISWDPASNTLDSGNLEGFDVVICLSGAGIADGRWSRSRKQQIVSSRVDAVKTISTAVARCNKPPGIFVCASAIGIYGTDHGDLELDESSADGEDFLPDVCRQWEDATGELKRLGMRVIHLRLGIVLSPEGGALRKMLLPFKLGIGGRLGNGQQWMSWVSVVDVIRVIEYVIFEDNISGPVNVVAPNPVRNVEFTRALCKKFNGSPVFGVPAIAIRMALGEMGETLLLKGGCVVPSKLLDSGFHFEHETIEVALLKLL